MSKNKEIAKFVVENIGGQENVDSLVHCATRLRFRLKDTDEVNEDTLKDSPDVLTAIESGGQYQVVIGNHVSKVYQEIIEEYNVDADDGAAADSEKTFESNNPVSIIFEYISGTFSPLIPALAGSGMIKAILAVLEMIGWLSPQSSTYAVLSAASNGLFYFFPIFIGVSAARFLKVNPFVGGIIGAGLLEPSFTALLETSQNLDFIGIPLILSEYANTVFPMLVAIAFFAPLERFLKKYIPNTVQLFAVPMFGILIMVPLTALAFGPFSQYVSGLIASGLLALLDISSVLTGIIFASAWPFLVLLGVHWGVTPIQLDNLARGGDPLNAMAAGATFAQMGIAFGIFLRYRNTQNLRSLSLAGTFSGVFAGVTEPILYGLILRYRRLIPIMVISGALGGGLAGFFGAEMLSYAFNSVLTIPAYGPIPQYVLSIGASFVLATVLTYIFGIGEEPEMAEATGANTTEAIATDEQTEEIADDKEELMEGKEITIQAPIEGELIPLEDVEDEVFASGAMGQGAAIMPTDGKLFAPFDGTVTTLFSTKHAIGLTDNNGVEILIHIGMDTVELDSEYFESHVENEQEVKQGDSLITFDPQKIKEAGYPIVTPIIVTNTDDFKQIVSENSRHVKSGDKIVTVVK